VNVTIVAARYFRVGHDDVRDVKVTLAARALTAHLLPQLVIPYELPDGGVDRAASLLSVTDRTLNLAAG
jgi:hypothetical protein